MTPCYIFDIDGTLANNKHRVHHLESKPKDWASYHSKISKDTPIHHVCEIARTLSYHGFNVVFCTGRHKGQHDETRDWLLQAANLVGPIFMREEGDHRPDHIVKRELLDDIRFAGFEPVMVFDDRNSVVNMWRDAGIPCAQVAEGDF